MKFEVRLLFMSLISRLIGVHKLLILNFYPFLQKYIQPHQRDVTSVLAYCAQASHDIVPPSEMEVVVRCIGDRFVWGNGSNEVVTAGLNAIRMICERCPLAMASETLQSLLLEAKQYKDKGTEVFVVLLEFLVFGRSVFFAGLIRTKMSYTGVLQC